jgi:multiple sugar transport system permease protein
VLSRKYLTRGVIMAIMALLVVVWLTPLVTTFLTAFKTPQEAAASFPWELPQGSALDDNLEWAWNRGRLGQSFVQSLIYAAGGAAFAIALASLAGFGLVELRPRRAFAWFLLIYAGTIFPFQMYLLPLFYLFQATSLYDTQGGLLAFYTAIAIPFCLFVLRNHFTTIDHEIVEAAQMDGLSNFGIYARIYMPLSIPAIAALFLFQFNWIWNDLLFGLTLAKSPEVRPIMAGLAGLRGTYAAQNTPGVLAGALLASVPTILIFILLGRYLLRGMKLTTSGE